MMHRILLAFTLGLSSFLWVSDIAAGTLQITTSPALQEALSTASAGTILLLAGGDYGTLDLRGLVMPEDQPLVIRGTTGGAGVRFSGMMLKDVENLVLENLVFDYTYASGDPGNLRPFQVNDSQGITIRYSIFDGDVARGVSPEADGFGVGFGLSLRGAARITLESSEIRGFLRGVVATESSYLTLRGNDLHNMRSDGMNFSQVEHVVIENNYIHDFNRSLASSDHADMIQFWTNGTTKPTRDIVISNNVLNSGGGWYTQSIFMRNDLVDRGLAGPEMFYRDILITENVIINAHLAGIAVGATNGLTISNNTVIRNARSEGETRNNGLWTPRISASGASRRVQILRNVTSHIVGYENQADWNVADNLFVQDQGRLVSGVFYDLVFTAATAGNPQDLASFAYKPGGRLDGAGLGAGRLAVPVPVVPGPP